MKHKIGILGGTFDPIHIGHLVIADTIRFECGLDKVIFIPAASPPHKQHCCFTPAADRYEMTRLATQSNPNFSVADIELRRSGLSYTVDTVKTLIEEYKGCSLYYIIGADTVYQLPTWHRVDELFELCYFIAAQRPGSMEHLTNAIRRLGKGGSKVISCTTPELNISSSYIRQCVLSGRPITYLVPSGVEQYIYSANLYKQLVPNKGRNK